MTSRNDDDLHVPDGDLGLTGLGQRPGEHGSEVRGARGEDDLVGVDLPGAHRDHDVAQLVVLPDHVELRQR